MLVQAFRRLALEVPGLRVGARSTLQDGVPIAGEGGFLVELRPRVDGPGALLSVGARGARVTTRSCARHARGGMSQISDHLSVKLVDGYRWADAGFASAAELASALLAHMQRRLRVVDEVEPPARAGAREVGGGRSERRVELVARRRQVRLVRRQPAGPRST
jgi:hypothetical protein